MESSGLHKPTRASGLHLAQCMRANVEVHSTTIHNSFIMPLIVAKITHVLETINPKRCGFAQCVLYADQTFA